MKSLLGLWVPGASARLPSLLATGSFSKGLRNLPCAEVNEEPEPRQGGNVSPGAPASVPRAVNGLCVVTFFMLNACAVMGAEARPGLCRAVTI